MKCLITPLLETMLKTNQQTHAHHMPCTASGPALAPCPKYCTLHTPSHLSVERVAWHKIGHKVEESLGAHPQGVSLGISGSVRGEQAETHVACTVLAMSV